MQNIKLNYTKEKEKCEQSRLTRVLKWRWKCEERKP